MAQLTFENKEELIRYLKENLKLSLEEKKIFCSRDYAVLATVSLDGKEILKDSY